MFREWRKLTCSGGKSSPTTATRDTSAKKLAEVEKYVAEPPSTFSPRPKGVSTVSKATVPTTTIPMELVLLFESGLQTTMPPNVSQKDCITRLIPISNQR